MDLVSKYLIYALVDPRNGEWRYIGKSMQGLKRPMEHSKPFKLKTEAHTHKTRWIQSLIYLGLKYEILVLEEFVTNEKLSEAEKEWIAEARKVGCNLTNATDGGDGISGWHHTQEVKTAAGLKATGNQYAKGRKHSEEAKALLVVARTGKLHSIESKKKIAQINQKTRGKSFIDNFGNIWPSTGACAKVLGVSRQTIRNVLKGRSFTCKGHVFKYLDNA